MSDETTHSSGDTEHVVQIEMLYQQRMTVQIPVNDIPATPEDAYHLVKNTDPEFIADVIPNRWNDLTSTGDLSLVDVSDVTESVRSVEPETDRTEGQQ